MTKAIDNPIQIYSYNYLNAKCLFDAAGGQSLDFLKLCDFECYNDDLAFRNAQTSLNFSCWFKDKFGEFLARNIDAIILQNCNVQTMQIKYIDNSENEVLAYTLTDNLNSEIRIILPQKITASKIIFNIQSTFDNEGIKIGQLRVLEKIFDLQATTNTDVNYVAKDGSLRTYNGRLITWTDFSKWSANIDVKNISKEQYKLLKDFVRRDGFITIIPFADFEDRDVYEVFIRRQDLDYKISRWSGLLDVSLKLEAQENAAN
jgi:hypothetical protein